MKINLRDFQFVLISLWKCPGFWGKYHTFSLLKMTYLLDKYIFFDKLFYESYYFLTLHRSYFTEPHVMARKHENSKKELISGVPLILQDEIRESPLYCYHEFLKY